jgi:hypothetical protein
MCPRCLQTFLSNSLQAADGISDFANYTLALHTAFSLLSGSTRCTSVVLMVTDGRPSDGNASYAYLTSAVSPTTSPYVVVYTLGSASDPTSIPLLLTCHTNAINIHIDSTFTVSVRCVLRFNEVVLCVSLYCPEQASMRYRLKCRCITRLFNLVSMHRQ